MAVAVTEEHSAAVEVAGGGYLPDCGGSYVQLVSRMPLVVVDQMDLQLPSGLLFVD